MQSLYTLCLETLVKGHRLSKYLCDKKEPRYERELRIAAGAWVCSETDMPFEEIDKLIPGLPFVHADYLDSDGNFLDSIIDHWTDSGNESDWSEAEEEEESDSDEEEEESEPVWEVTQQDIDEFVVVNNAFANGSNVAIATLIRSNRGFVIPHDSNEENPFGPESDDEDFSEHHTCEICGFEIAEPRSKCHIVSRDTPDSVTIGLYHTYLEKFGPEITEERMDTVREAIQKDFDYEGFSESLRVLR